LSRTQEPEQGRTACPVSPFRLSLGGVLAVGNLITVACGGGALSIPAAELGADVLATDLSSGMLDLLRHRAEGGRRLRLARNTPESDVLANLTDSPNETIDVHETQVTAGLCARVPETVLLLEHVPALEHLQDWLTELMAA